MGRNESYLKPEPVNIGLRYTEVKNALSFLSTKILGNLRNK